jgi:hypothetical protein
MHFHLYTAVSHKQNNRTFPLKKYLDPKLEHTSNKSNQMQTKKIASSENEKVKSVV